MGPDAYIGIDWKLSAARGVHFVRGDTSTLPFQDGAFDTIICTEVVEHVRDERQLASELARVAKRDAVMVLSAPFVHGLHEAPYDYRRLTSIGLARLLTDAGFSLDVMVSVGGPIVVTVDGAVRWVDNRSRRVAGRLFGRGGRAHAGVSLLSKRAQQLLAIAVLRNPFSQVGPIDPESASPRLTLGYVVSAHRDER